VSGDFYWSVEKDGCFYLAVCDSTGHGVPGAFMSLLNISFLNEAISEKNISLPNEVLNHTRKRLVENISSDGAQDGMDGILLCFDKNKKEISYSAAHNAPVLVTNGTITELEADNMPIGLADRQDSFKHETLNLQPGTILYLYTDGYADQFGGPKGKKFKYKQLKELLSANSHLSMREQKQKLEETFENWKGNNSQTDDVLVIGIKI
jgi:serine phosphatase RsbU (regulator of sigma subunit)